MANRWAIRTIAECAASKPYSTQIGPFGKALMADEYIESGIPVLRGVNVNQGRFHDDDFVFISEETADRLHKFESFPGDVLLVHKGTLGQIGLMPSDRRFKRYIMGNSMMRVRCDPNKLLPEFLYYWLSSSEGQHYLFSRVSQVGVPQLQTPLTTLREASLPVPPIPEQQWMVKVLSVLDDKIELNRRMNETLECIARALFKSWFVDFDPLRTKAQGRSTTQPESLAALFPDSFESTELGDIPKGWQACQIGDVCKRIFSGGTPSTSVNAYWDGGLPWLSSGETRAPFITSTEKTITQEGVENSSTKFVRAGATVIASAGQGNTRGQTSMLMLDTYVNQSVVALLAEKTKVTDAYLFFELERRYEEFRRVSDGHSSRGSLTTKLLGGLSTVLPPRNLVEHFDLVVEPMIRRIAVSLREARTLSELRDSLLPKLISGELRVSASAEGGDRRVGVVWHTQGSGKSLTMAFYAGRLVLDPKLHNPTIVVITDRNDLDDQLYGTFSRCHELLRQAPVQALDREHLRSLVQVSSGGVVFTTIQKFMPDESGVHHLLLSERRNIIVIADEAHRSQYEFGLSTKKRKDGTVYSSYGLATNLRDALPYASFIGFTGTPIEETDANTRSVFGDYISIYDIQRAVEDKATVLV